MSPIPTRPVGNLLRVKCPWCKAAIGCHCVVRGTTRPLRDADGQYVSHPAREEAFHEQG
jgi:hypothetical protein